MNILELKQTEYAEVAKFLSIIFNHTEKFWLDRFHFLWDLNPAFSKKYERGFVIKDGSRIVGFIGKFPTKFLSDGKEGIAWNGTGLAIHPGYRKMGLGKEIRTKHFESCEDNFLFATTPADITQKINKSLGFKPIPHDMGQKSYHAIFPVNKFYSILLFKFFLSAQRTNIVPIVRNLFFKRSKYIALNNKKIQIKLIKNPGKSIDQLWKKKRDEYLYTNVRTSDILSWYLLPIEGINNYILAIYFDTVFIGYVLVKKCGFQRNSILLIADIWILSEIELSDIIDKIIQYIYNFLTDNTTVSIIYPIYKQSEYNLFKSQCLFGGKRQDYYICPADNTKTINGEHYFTYNLGDKLQMPVYRESH